jgi:hypothetical protein
LLPSTGRLSAIIGRVSAIDRNRVRLQSESLSAFVGTFLRPRKINERREITM